MGAVHTCTGRQMTTHLQMSVSNPVKTRGNELAPGPQGIRTSLFLLVAAVRPFLVSSS